MPASDQQDPRATLASTLEAKGLNTHLTLAWRPEALKYRVERAQIHEEVSGRFHKLAQATASQLAERTAIAYQPDWPLAEHEYFQLTQDELISGNLFTSLADFLNLKRFTRKRLTKPRLYVVAVQTPHGNAFFGRRMAYLQVISQKRGVFGAVWDGSSFNTLQDSYATFATDFDWVLWEQSLYILHAGNFHAEFRDSQALKAAVTEHVQSISEHVEIANAAAMVTRCQASVPMASKLKQVAEHGLQLTSTPAQLKAYADAYGIKVQWDGDKLVFDGSLEGQWSILKLLDEDRTEGPVSHRHYESAAKREV